MKKSTELLGISGLTISLIITLPTFIAYLNTTGTISDNLGTVAISGALLGIAMKLPFILSLIEDTLETKTRGNQI